MLRGLPNSFVGMKLLFPALLLSVGLASCSTDDPEPSPALTGGTWTLQSEVVLATDAKSGATTTIPVSADGPLTMQYQDDTHYTLDMKATAGGGGKHFQGTYSLQGKVLTYNAIYSWHTGVVVPRTVEVADLSAHKKVLVEKYDYFEPWDSSLTRYVRTYTFSR